MKVLQFVFLAAVTIALTGCGGQDAPSASVGNSGALQKLLQTDRDFSSMSAKRGAQAAFKHYLMEDAVSLPQGGAAVHGREAIAADLPAAGAGILIWTPVAGEVAASGDLGFTWGTYEFQGKDASGEPTVGYGKYTTVWKRDTEGKWRVVLDMGNQSPGPASGSEPEGSD